MVRTFFCDACENSYKWGILGSGVVLVVGVIMGSVAVVGVSASVGVSTDPQLSKGGCCLVGIGQRTVTGWKVEQAPL
jgi:hypothetical protein